MASPEEIADAVLWLSSSASGYVTGQSISESPPTYLCQSACQLAVGQQYLIVSAGGNSATTQKGDYVVANALPQ